MKKTVLRILTVTAISSLLACGGDNSPFVPTTSVSATVQSAQQDNPELALRILPLDHLDRMDNYQAKAAGLTAKSVALEAAAISGTATSATVNDLETAYETMFCQLNAQHQVTMQSPECQANISYTSQQSGTGFFNLNNKPILNNPLGVTGILFQPVTYSTQVTLPQGIQTYQVSGGMIMPQGITGAQIKGVVVYFHATQFNKSVVGSNYTNNGETRLTAQVFASQGYIVITPDYVGQGIDWQNVHPYVLYPQVSAKTAVDLLSAVAPLIKAQYNLGDSATLKLFSAGYSEGGAYSIWFTSFLYGNPGMLDGLYQLKHSVGMEGAYNTSQVTKGFLFDDVSTAGGNPYNIQTQVVTNLVKPLLSADAFLSYATYQLNGDVAAVFDPKFYNLDCTWPVPQSLCNVNGQQIAMAAAFAQQAASPASQVLFSALRKSANGATYPADLVLSSRNSVDSLVSSTFLSDSSQAQLDAALRAADVNLSQVPDNSVSIISLDKDSVVIPNNYTALLAAYPGKIRFSYLLPENKFQVVSPFSYIIGKKPVYVSVDHMQAPAYEFLYALNIFNQY